MPADLIVIGDIIRQERERRQLSQENFAALAGLSRSFLGEIERGEANLSFTSFIAITEGLALQSSELLQEYERRITEKS